MAIPHEIVFLHIPKTAGTSLRIALERAHSRHVHLFDYGPAEPKTSGVIRRLRYGCEPVDGIGLLPLASAMLLCGHFQARDYLHRFAPESFVTFLRHPVDRVISAYHHHRRHTGERRSLADFARDEEHRNLQTRLLATLPLEACGFVGLVECFREDCLDLGQRLGTDLRYVRANTKPIFQQLRRVAASRDLVAELNADDMALYRSALSIRAARRARSAAGTTAWRPMHEPVRPAVWPVRSVV